MSALAGVRVLVTRAQHQSAELDGLLRAHGAQPVEFPVIAIQPLVPSAAADAALSALEEYDWVGFTSANGARIAVNRWNDLHERGGRWPTSVSVAAVGSATADTLERLGVPVDAMPDDFQGAALPAALGDVAGRRMLLLRAEIAAPGPVETLRSMGARVDDIPIYRTVPATPDDAHFAAVRFGADAVILTSPSGVRSFLDIANTVSLCVDGLIVACIGPVTARACDQAGLAVHAVPEHHTAAGLADALAAYWREASISASGSPSAREE